MNNLVSLTGIISEVHQFSDSVASLRIKVTEESNDKSYSSVFSLTCFKDLIPVIKGVTVGSEVKIHGRLKNSKFTDKAGKEVWKLEVIAVKFKVLQLAEARPEYDDTEVPF